VSATTALLIDTDAGIDDAVGLWWAATNDAVDIVAVTSVWGNVDVGQATSNVRRWSRIISVSLGSSTPDEFRGWPGM